MTPKNYGTIDAAKYLDLSEPTIKYHVKEGNLKPGKIGHSLVFSKRELDRFQRRRRKPGRPKGKRKK